MQKQTISVKLILDKMQDDTNCGKLKKLILTRYSILGGYRCEILDWDEIYI
jgi:hypothetical protein